MRLSLVVMTAVFWLLDARYFQQEKWFRNLYDEVRVESFDERPDYRITPTKTLRRTASFWARVFNWSTAGLYLPLLILLWLFWWTQ